MFQEILTENGTKFVIAAVVVLLGLVCLALVLWIIRGRPSSPFIRGGRNRTPRLAVLDAAAIDTRRRLVLVRRDDVEHLLMIGGPTDIVIETRIAIPSADTTQPVEKAPQKVERAEPTPVQHETPAKAAVEPIVAARAATIAATATERRPAATPEGVSAMGKVLYAGEDSAAAARAVPTRTATQPVTTGQQPQTSTQQRTPEHRIEDVLEQSRQRVLTPQPAATTTQAAIGQTVQRPVTAQPLAKPAAAIDNPALVSEFEKILEAEITGGGATAATRTTAQATTAQTTANPTQTANTLGQAQPVAKSREETEAEMARLLGEIAASRKA
ncbi:flagellar biosynthetic protein FliO [Sinorhizobium sp. RAC02]|uniref:flagellar biosynthetic protein FliO n=1 Tax=Sinorhizobium sp. RAC02 TaxID=1842534 RepID=UPI00083E2B4F|nr:flagellar biosynthetic protein FliO [Sinorhizobium sp. RAC02]AOF92079.1 flagellar biosynthesis, FliO family protein [Sinorhizobium sp. RAC02]